MTARRALAVVLAAAGALMLVGGALVAFGVGVAMMIAGLLVLAALAIP